MTHPAALTACMALMLLSLTSAATSDRRVREPQYERLDPPVDASRLARAEHETQTWCDDVLGCLNITDEWYSEYRPINVLPLTRAKINTRFYLHTPENRATDEDVFLMAGDAWTVDASTFNPSRPTKFIIHGFIENGNVGWMKDMAQELLNQGDYNVIRVNWGGGSLPMYFQASANTRVVGLEIGYLVNWLTDQYGVDPLTVHLIGHSLGSHISGYAGEQIKGLGRISGMDPAGPYFTGTLPMVRLDPTDAVFVDALHTDADTIFLLGYGTEQPMGHLDFYPNSGHDQPGCDPVSIGIQWILPGDVGEDSKDIVSCSHARAIYLYMDSIRSSCNFLSHECASYAEFEAGNCVSCGDDNAQCAYMGFHADEYPHKDTRVNARFYDDTDKKEPFCYYQYEVSLLADKPSEAEDWVVGKLFGTFYGDNGAIIDHTQITDDHTKIYHGEVNKIVFNSHTDVGKVMRTELEWRYNDQALKPGTYCMWPLCNRNLYVATVQISPFNAYPESKRIEQTEDFCSNNGETTEVKDGKSVSFASTGSCITEPLE